MFIGAVGAGEVAGRVVACGNEGETISEASALEDCADSIFCLRGNSARRPAPVAVVESGVALLALFGSALFLPVVAVAGLAVVEVTTSSC